MPGWVFPPPSAARRTLLTNVAAAAASAADTVHSKPATASAVGKMVAGAGVVELLPSRSGWVNCVVLPSVPLGKVVRCKKNGRVGAVTSTASAVVSAAGAGRRAPRGVIRTLLVAFCLVRQPFRAPASSRCARIKNELPALMRLD